MWRKLGCANFGTHENDVGDAETDCHEGKHGRQMGPDQIQALAESQGCWQYPLRLALQRHTEHPSGGVE